MTRTVIEVRESGFRFRTHERKVLVDSRRPNRKKPLRVSFVSEWRIGWGAEFTVKPEKELQAPPPSLHP